LEQVQIYRFIIAKLTFGGTGTGDLQIYHDGNNSYINDTGTGALLIRGSNVALAKYTGETMVNAFADGRVDLYYDNAIKLATTPTGIDVTGTATMDGLTVEGSSTGTLSVVNFLNTDTSANQTANRLGLGISNSSAANYTYIEAKETGIDAYADMNFYTGVTATKRMTLGVYGDISFYDDTGTSPALFWDASAESLGISTTSPSAKLDIRMSDSNGNYGRGRNGNLNLENTNTSVTEGGWLSISGYMGNSALNGQWPMGYISGGKQTTAADGDYGGYLGLWTTSSGANGEANSGGYERVRIDSSGNVGIGTSSPIYKLSVSGNIGITDGVSTGLLAMSGGNYYMQNTGAYSTIFQTNGTERLRIDASGNLLVGNTAVNPASNYGTIKGFGYAYATGKVEIATNANDAVMEIGKNNATDGSLMVFRKQGAVVGTIGTTAGNLWVTGATNGIRLAGGTFNATNASGTVATDTVSLGYSNGRWTDLYLSGGVDFGDAGGTGSSSSTTLDSYEEGTFTPELSDASTGGNLSGYSVRNARYTKVGRMVTVVVNFINITTTGMTASNLVYLQGLPFSVVNVYLLNFVGSQSSSGITGAPNVILAGGNSTSIYTGIDDVSDITSGTADYYITLTYEAA
jgi:hypothetical protein